MRYADNILLGIITASVFSIQARYLLADSVFLGLSLVVLGLRFLVMADAAASQDCLRRYVSANRSFARAMTAQARSKLIAKAGGCLAAAVLYSILAASPWITGNLDDLQLVVGYLLLSTLMLVVGTLLAVVYLQLVSPRTIRFVPSKTAVRKALGYPTHKDFFAAEFIGLLFSGEPAVGHAFREELGQHGVGVVYT
jgi:hypothetical protein